MTAMILRTTQEDDHSSPSPMNDETMKRAPQIVHISNRKKFAKTKGRKHRKLIIIGLVMLTLYACVAVGFYSTVRQGILPLDSTRKLNEPPAYDRSRKNMEHN